MQPGWNIASGVRVDGPAATLVSGVECAEHFGKLSAAALANYYAVGTHAQGVAEQLGLTYCAASLNVCLLGFKRDDVWVIRSDFA
jgi:hypothetical protein